MKLKDLTLEQAIALCKTHDCFNKKTGQPECPLIKICGISFKYIFKIDNPDKEIEEIKK